MKMQEARARRGRGRPRGESGTREAIVAEARRQFSERGYGRTTLRGIARAVGVDPRLVLHYFDSKQDLFVASVELPVEPEVVVDSVFAGSSEGAPGRAARLLVSLIDTPETRRPFLALLRAAVAEPEAAALIRGVLTERLLGPIAARLGGERPELRANLVASQLVGLMVARHIVESKPLLEASQEDLVRAIEPVFEHYFHGDWIRPD